MAAAARFERFAARKTRRAEEASFHGLATIEDCSGGRRFEIIGSEWSRRLYDGPFHLVPLTGTPDANGGASNRAASDVPAISLVFVQSRDGNTVTDDPEELGGGATDTHLIYEGLSRVAADGVMAGATTAAGEGVFFSVWHPEFAALRMSLGLRRHPAQIVLTGRACIDPDASLIFNVPGVPVIVIGSVHACGVLASAASSRPWMHIVPMQGGDLRPPLRRLRTEFGIRRISCIGGRTTATGLLDAGLVQDICLTTTAREGGQPNSPFYAGARPPGLSPIVRKRGLDPQAPMLFEHLAVR